MSKEIKIGRTYMSSAVIIINAVLISAALLYMIIHIEDPPRNTSFTYKYEGLKLDTEYVFEVNIRDKVTGEVVYNNQHEPVFKVRDSDGDFEIKFKNIEPVKGK